VPTSGRLLDFSYAGYRAGAEDIPNPPVSANLKTMYGAKGDGTTDDTQAFLSAIADAAGDQVTVLYLPPGAYVLSRKLDISKRVIIRGAGRNATSLLMTRSLTQLGGAWTGNSPHTYGPALINWWGAGKTDASSLLARVTRCGPACAWCGARTRGAGVCVCVCVCVCVSVCVCVCLCAHDMCLRAGK
jgi:hypothetical protein